MNDLTAEEQQIIAFIEAAVEVIYSTLYKPETKQIIEQHKANQTSEETRIIIQELLASIYSDLSDITIATDTTLPEYSYYTISHKENSVFFGYVEDYLMVTAIQLFITLVAFFRDPCFDNDIAAWTSFMQYLGQYISVTKYNYTEKDSYIDYIHILKYFVDTIYEAHY